MKIKISLLIFSAVILITLIFSGCSSANPISDRSIAELTTLSSASIDDNSLSTNTSYTSTANETTSDSLTTNIPSRKNLETTTTKKVPEETKNQNSSTSSTKITSTTSTTKKPVRTWEYEGDMSDELFKLVNDYRASQGVAKLTYDPECANGAKTRSEYNAKNQILAAHEVAQIGTGGAISKTPQAMFENWKNSEGHRKSMLRTEEIMGGAAIYSDSNGYYYAIFQFSDGW